MEKKKITLGGIAFAKIPKKEEPMGITFDYVEEETYKAPTMRTQIKKRGKK